MILFQTLLLLILDDDSSPPGSLLGEGVGSRRCCRRWPKTSLPGGGISGTVHSSTGCRDAHRAQGGLHHVLVVRLIRFTLAVSCRPRIGVAGIGKPEARLEAAGRVPVRPKVLA